MVCPLRACYPRASATRSRTSGTHRDSWRAMWFLSPIWTRKALHEGKNPSVSPPRTASILPFTSARPPRQRQGPSARTEPAHATTLSGRKEGDQCSRSAASLHRVLGSARTVLRDRAPPEMPEQWAEYSLGSLVTDWQNAGSEQNATRSRLSYAPANRVASQRVPGRAPPALPVGLCATFRDSTLARIMRERTRTLTPTLCLAEGERAISMPSPPGGEGQGEGERTTRNAYS